VRPSDPGTPFAGFLLEYVNEKCLVLHSRHVALALVHRRETGMNKSFTGSLAKTPRKLASLRRV
jgi:hypothetical protein